MIRLVNGLKGFRSRYFYGLIEEGYTTKEATQLAELRMFRVGQWAIHAQRLGATLDDVLEDIQNFKE